VNRVETLDAWFVGLPLPPGFVLPVSYEETHGGLNKVTFPDGSDYYTHAGPSEVTLIYNEIMVGQEYFRHGLSIDDARCILDVGGNIGMFTVAAKRRAPGAVVYTFEPIPDTFEALQMNLRSHGCTNVHAFNVAIGAEDHSRLALTYFPHMPGNTTAYFGMKVDQRPVMDQIFGSERADYLY
jgi:hypothetical protein